MSQPEHPPKLVTTHGQLYKYDSYTALSVSVFFWISFYMASRYVFASKSPEYSSRVTAGFHGLMASICGLSECFVTDHPMDNPEDPTTSSQSFLLVLSLGYFIEDLIWCLYHQTETNLMIGHHVYSCIALYRILFKGYSGGQACCGLGSLEFTNPYLQARWFIRSHGYKNTLLFNTVEMVFAILFFIIRVGLGTFFTLIILTQPKNDTEFKLLTVVIYVISWMFMVNIFRHLAKKYLKTVNPIQTPS